MLAISSHVDHLTPPPPPPPFTLWLCPPRAGSGLEQLILCCLGVWNFWRCFLSALLPASLPSLQPQKRLGPWQKLGQGPQRQFLSIHFGELPGFLFFCPLPRWTSRGVTVASRALTAWEIFSSHWPLFWVARFTPGRRKKFPNRMSTFSLQSLSPEVIRQTTLRKKPLQLML